MNKHIFVFFKYLGMFGDDTYARNVKMYIVGKVISLEKDDI
jgi:hypothetical protein